MTRATLLGLLALAIPLAAADARRGPSGRVVDPEGAPIAGARVCLVVTGAEDLCVPTDDQGRYALPASDAVSVRVQAKGFLPVNVAAVPQESPVILERAASLVIRVLDASTGAGIDSSKVTLVYSSGRQVGPLPANRSGLSVATLPPGEIRPVVAADGYLEATGSTGVLVAGKQLVLEVRLTRAAAKPSSP